MGDRIALLGDAIVIYADLVQQAKSQNELMMVLGHELGILPTATIGEGWGALIYRIEGLCHLIQ